MPDAVRAPKFAVAIADHLEKLNLEGVLSQRRLLANKNRAENQECGTGQTHGRCVVLCEIEEAEMIESE